jgi:antitoxin component YwqK of YwqJK toxin-antitoxin module
MVAPLVIVALVLTGSNSPEKALARTQEEVLVKLNLRCGTSLTVVYDGDSLRQHNRDIRYDQTGGDLECNEPLRYLWALCGTDAGKAVVRRAELREVVCRGTPNATGSLTVKAGVVTVERAFEEETPFLRARAQFEAALKTKVTVEDDPYADEAWDQFRREPTPVLSTTDYCLVGGSKVRFDWSAASASEVLNKGLPVKCLERGKVVIDVTVKNRQPTGLLTFVRDEWRRTFQVVDGKPEGLEEVRTSGRLLSQATYRAGDRVWVKEFHPNGALKRYSRRFPTPASLSVDLREDGTVAGLECGVEAKDDEVLRPWCGFGAEKTVDVYDGAGRVRGTVSHRDGLKTKQVAGSGPSAWRSSVRFLDGKPDGEERRTRPDGTLEATLSWSRGVQHGPERRFSDDGKKVVSESLWRDGQLERRVEFFLNGNPRLEEVLDGRTRRVTEFFDLGGVRRAGGFVRCAGRFGADRWCEDGMHTSFFEGGKKAGEDTFQAGQRVRSQRWYESGVLAETEAFVDGRLSARSRFLPDGGVERDEAYEADGSRKVTR